MHPSSCSEEEKVGMRGPHSAAAASGLLLNICGNMCGKRCLNSENFNW